MGDVKCLSHADLENITDNFSEENLIRPVRHGRLFRGLIGDGERKGEVTVKTWDFVFLDGIKKFEVYPRKFRNEIVLLARSEIKAHPFLAKLHGFCFEKNQGVVYDLEFNTTTLQDSLTSPEFHWKRTLRFTILLLSQIKLSSLKKELKMNLVFYLLSRLLKRSTYGRIEVVQEIILHS